MNFELGTDEIALIESVRQALARTATLSAGRDALDGGPRADLWPEAVKGGWNDLPELLYGALVLIECGRVLAPTGLLGHLTARFAVPNLDASKRTAYVPLDGKYVPDAAEAEALVAETPNGGLLLVDQAEVELVGNYDASRPTANVTVHSGTPVEGDARHAWNVAQTLLAAETLGASEAALAMAVDYAKQRKAFGRAIGSFQAIKHQLTDGLRLNENARSLLYYACYAAGSPEFELAANAARFAADQAIGVVTQRCIAIHGGIGATWEHDAHLYFRRAQLTRLLLGGQAGAGEKVVTHVISG